MFNSWNRELPFSLTCCPPYQKTKMMTCARVKAVLMPLCCYSQKQYLARYQCLLKSNFASMPFLCVEFSSCPLGFFALCLPFCPLLHPFLQYLCLWSQAQCNIYFGLLVCARLCEPSEMLGAAVGPRTPGFVPPQHLKYCC